MKVPSDVNEYSIKITQIVAALHDCPPLAVFSGRKYHSQSLVRSIVWQLMRDAGWSTTQISYLTGRHHTAVVVATGKMRAMYAEHLEAARTAVALVPLPAPWKHEKKYEEPFSQFRRCPACSSSQTIYRDTESGGRNDFFCSRCDTSLTRIPGTSRLVVTREAALAG